MSNRGGKRRRHAPRKLNYDQVREIMVLISQGVLGKVIADSYNVSRRTLYASIKRMDAETASVDAEITPHAWAIQGSAIMWNGENAEIDAKAEARRCGGTCTAYQVFTKGLK